MDVEVREDIPAPRGARSRDILMLFTNDSFFTTPASVRGEVLFFGIY